MANWRYSQSVKLKQMMYLKKERQSAVTSWVINACVLKCDDRIVKKV